MELHLALWFLVLVVVAFALHLRSKRHGRLPLPPGPSSLPLIGNVFNMPTTNIAANLGKMTAQYGDVMHLKLFGKRVIVLGSHQAAVDLLEKRSANYSDRPPSIIADASSANIVFALQHYGPAWRAHRRAFHQNFNPVAVAQYAAIQRHEAHGLVLRLIKSPDHFLQHIRRLFGSSIMRVAYGIDVDEERIDFLKMADDMLSVFVPEHEFGKHIVEFLPLLRFLPSWMPGATYKRESVKWKPLITCMADTPWRLVKDAAKKGIARPSMAAGLLSGLHLSQDDEQETEEEVIAKHATVSAYAAGADTILSAVEVFFLAMASYPEVQEKAHLELDSIIGPDRLPEFDDMESLPYLRALIKECMRWRSVVPLGFPHRTLKDDEYAGYFIPEGSIVLANLSAFLRDSRVYPDPERFMPERFLKDGHLNPDICDPAMVAFGYGRRICPGRHYAQSLLFMVAATVLHTMSISAPLDKEGKPIRLEGEMSQGVVSHPEPFKCVIKPRSQKAEALVCATCSDTAPARAVGVRES